MTREHIGIIGAGALGHALGDRLTAAGHQANYWDIDRKLVTVSSLDELAQHATLILICTPSSTNRLIARDIAQAISTGQSPAVLSLAKGVEPGFITMDQVLVAELGRRFVTGVLSGPMLAGEIAQGDPSAALIATTNLERTTSIANLMQDAGLVATASSEPTGVALCGVFKNIYALSLGLADGLGLSFNSKSILTTMAVTEMSGLLEHLGADPKLAYTMAGLGDLLTTGWSGASFNWRVGHNRAEGSIEAKGEGVNSLRQLVQVLDPAKYPLLQATARIFIDHQDPDHLRSVLTGPAGTWID